MSIIKELEKRGKLVEKSNFGLRGYRKTEAGIVVGRNETHYDRRLYILLDENGKQYPCDHANMYIISGTEYEGKIKSIKEAEKLAADGKIFSFDSYDLYSEYYDFEHDKELENCIFNNYSLRSKEYLSDVKKEIGLSSYSVECNGNSLLNGDGYKKVDIHEFQWQPFSVGQIGNMWVAESGSGNLSDYTLISFSFDHDPTDYEVKIAATIAEFSLHPYEVVYCTEQSKEINWLDISGDIFDKYITSKNYYEKSLEQ